MDLDQLKSLLVMLHEHDVSEFQYSEGELAIQLRLGAVAPPAPVAIPAAPVVQAAAAPVVAEAAPAAAPAAGGTVIEAPMVGTFYAAPSPGASPFAEVGKAVSVGQTLCIIEAMKLMNEIEAEVAGTIVECLVKDGQPVEYGQALFRIQPN